jgi:spermidine synthase
MPKDKILYSKRSSYNDIIVTENGSRRTLWSPRDVKQTELNMKNPHLPNLEYARDMLMFLAFVPDAGMVAVLGLGGGSIPLAVINMHRECFVDVIEIDEEMIHVAREFFGLPMSPFLNLVLDDAGNFIKTCKTQYDAIIMDTYIGRTFIDKASRNDFFYQAALHLAKRGVLTVNLMSSDSAVYFDTLWRIGVNFDYLWTVECEYSRNVIVFASNYKISHSSLVVNAQAMEQKIAKTTGRFVRSISFGDFSPARLIKRLTYHG